jgi:hypothetical protein
MYCQHQSPCRYSVAVDHDAAKIVASHPGQGWNLLCNGAIVFEDTGELLPDGRPIEPHRGPARALRHGRGRLLRPIISDLRMIAPVSGAQFDNLA